MKNTNQLAGLVRAAVLCLTAALLAACDADDFTRTAGAIPDQEDLTAVGGVLRRETTPEQVSILKIDEGQPATDAVFYQLTQPAAQAVTVTLDVDATLLDEYNKGKEGEAVLPLFPVEKLTFVDGKTFTVAAGERISNRLTLSFSREGVEKGMYLLPLRASVGDKLRTDENDQILYYRLVVAQHIEESDLDDLGFKIVCYVNTEEMNPLVGMQFSVWCYDMLNDIEATKTWIDVEILRKAAIKLHESNGRAILDLGMDLQYVLDNRDKYILPLQKSGRKVLMCIQGGNTGLGFCNLSDEQITDFIYQLKYVCDNYGLDGVNFFDIDALYGKDGTPEPIPASYAKLIKATKEALGSDRLVTVACDAESTEFLAEEQEGIEAGKYIDMAWSGIFDKVVNPYEEEAELQPIIGLEPSKWGSVLLKIYNDSQMYKNKEVLKPAIVDLYRNHTEAANIFAFYDIPSTMQGTELGPGGTFNQILCEALTDEDLEYDGMLYDTQLTREYMQFYHSFDKDW